MPEKEVRVLSNEEFARLSSEEKFTYLNKLMQQLLRDHEQREGEPFEPDDKPPP